MTLYNFLYVDMENYCRRDLNLKRKSYLLSIHYCSGVKSYTNIKRTNVTNLCRVRILTTKIIKLKLAEGSNSWRGILGRPNLNETETINFKSFKRTIPEA